jgi:hypothetical protein
MVDQVNASRMEDNGFGLSVPATREASVEVASTRAMEEVKAAMTIAKRFPRDETASYQRIMQACKRKGLAEASLYAYPKGGQTVTGPSIRLAEMLAQNWGNCDFGVIELEQRKGESSVMSYAWDLETNTRQTKIFNIKHERHTKHGVKALADPRDIYELTANQGARRLRACILGIIPGDVVDAAVAECEKTMAGNNSEPLVDRIRSMVTAFAEMSVTQEMLEARLQHKIEATTEAELVQLKKIYRSLRDGMADRADFFEVGGASATTADMDSRIADAAAKRRATNQQPPSPLQPAPPAAAHAEAERNTSITKPASVESKAADLDTSASFTRSDAQGSEGEARSEAGGSPSASDKEVDFQSFKTQCLEALKARGKSPAYFASGWLRLLKERGLRSTKESDIPAKDWAAIIESAVTGTGVFA